VRGATSCDASATRTDLSSLLTCQRAEGNRRCRYPLRPESPPGEGAIRLPPLAARRASSRETFRRG